MKNKQERCDQCGRFVPEGTLIVDGDDDTKCICQNCGREKRTLAEEYLLRRKRTMVRKIKLELAGLDGNAFVLLGAFSQQARREGWTQEEINAVLNDAKSSNYDHLLQVLIAHCDGDEYDDGFDDDDFEIEK